MFGAPSMLATPTKHVGHGALRAGHGHQRVRHEAEGEETVIHEDTLLLNDLEHLLMHTEDGVDLFYGQFADEQIKVNRFLLHINGGDEWEWRGHTLRECIRAAISYAHDDGDPTR